MKVNRRAQVTIFVVIAVVIVALASVSYLVVKNKESDVPKTPEAAAFKTYIDGCLKDSLEEVLIVMGQRGGYYNLPSNSLNDELSVGFLDYNVPYYLNEKNLLAISKPKLVDELRKGFEQKAKECVDNYETTLEVSTGRITSQFFLEEDVVKAVLNFPITLLKQEDDTSSTVSSFEVEVPIRLNAVYENAAEIVILQLADPYNICIDCLDAIRDPNILVTGHLINDNTIVFELADYSSQVRGDKQSDQLGPYMYYFAIKYIDWSCDNLPSDIDNYIKEECDLR